MLRWDLLEVAEAREPGPEIIQGQLATEDRYLLGKEPPGIARQGPALTLVSHARQCKAAKTTMVDPRLQICQYNREEMLEFFKEPEVEFGSVGDHRFVIRCGETSAAVGRRGRVTVPSLVRMPPECGRLNAPARVTAVPH
jgi:hypothetical protein